MAAVVASPAAAVPNNTPGANDSGPNPGAGPATKMEPYSVVEAPSTKTHTLFMGADFSLNLDRDNYPVTDVVGSNWIIVINGRRREVSARHAPQDIKIAPNLKLTETSAFIQGFTRMPAYSYGNDPNVLLTRGMAQAAMGNATVIGAAQDAMNVVDTVSNRALGPARSFALTDSQLSASAIMSKIYAGTDPLGLGNSSPVPGNMAAAAASGLAGLGNGLETSPGALASKGLDALDVAFDIRCSRLLRDPYVITTARFHNPSAKAGMVQNLIYAQSIHPIDEHLSSVHFVETGFPFNYELLEFRVHLYNDGEEIATNISEDRVELTRDEAFQYVRMEYVAAHRGQTLPAVPAMAKLPGDFKARITEGMYRDPVYVRVDQQGMAFEAFSDPACTKQVNDAYLNDVIRRIRFKPALNDGRPVQGTVQLSVANLRI